MNNKQNKSKELYNKVENYLVDEVGNYVEFVGGKALLGRIFGLLMIQGDPISLKDISRKLNVSKPAVSNTLNIGLQAELFKKVYNPDYPREGFYKVGVDFLEMMIDPGLKKLSLLRDKISEALKIMEESDIDIESDENIKSIYERTKYLCEAFEILLDEYNKFGDRIKERLKQLKT